MAFGVQNPTKKNQQSRSDTFSTQVADLPDSNGNLEEGTTYGGYLERSEEFYLGKGETFKNAAVDLQNGTELVTGATHTETAGEYEKWSETRKIYPGDEKYKAVSPPPETVQQAAQQAAPTGGEAQE